MSFADVSFASAPFSSQVEDSITVALTGINVNAVLNNVNLATDQNITVTGPADIMDMFVGTVIAEAQSIIPITAGVQADTALGTAVAAADSNSSVTGEEITSDVGTATAAAGATGVVTGELISTALGVETVTGTAVITPTGVQADTALGTAVAAADALVSVTGVSMQFADGTATVTANAIVEPTGLQITFSEGTATAPASVILTGVAMSSFVGNMRSTPWANVVTGASNTWTEVAA